MLAVTVAVLVVLAASSSDCQSTGIQLALRAALAVALIAWLFAGRREAMSSRVDGLDIAVCALALLALLSTVWSAAKYCSLLASLDVVVLLGTLLIVRHTARPAAVRAAFLVTLLSVGAVVSLYALWQVVLRMPIPDYWLPESVHADIPTRASAFAENPNLLALYAVVTLTVALAAVLGRERDFDLWTVGLSVSFVLSAGALLATFSRAGWVAALFSCGVCAIWWFRHSRARTLRRLALLAVLVSPLLLWQSRSVVSRTESTVAADDQTAEHRLFMWKAAGRAFRSHPILGNGWGTLNAVYARYRPPGDPRLFALISLPGSAHNSYFEVAADMGVVGLVGCGVLLLLTAKALASGVGQPSAGKPWDGAVMRCSAWGCLAGLCVFSVFQSGIAQTGNMLLLVVLVGVALGPPAERAAAARPHPRWIPAATRGFLLAAGVWVLAVVTLHIAGDRFFQQGLRAAYRSPTEAALRQLRLGQMLQPLNPVCDLAIGGVYEQWFLANHADADWLTAMASYRRGARLDRTSGIYFVKMAHLWELRYDLPRAVECYRRAIALDPYDGAYRYQLGRLLGELGDYREAVEELRAAWELFAARDELRRRQLARRGLEPKGPLPALGRVQEKMGELAAMASTAVTMPKAVPLDSPDEGSPLRFDPRRPEGITKGIHPDAERSLVTALESSGLHTELLKVGVALNDDLAAGMVKLGATSKQGECLVLPALQRDLARVVQTAFSRLPELDHLDTWASIQVRDERGEADRPVVSLSVDRQSVADRLAEHHEPEAVLSRCGCIRVDPRFVNRAATGTGKAGGAPVLGEVFDRPALDCNWASLTSRWPGTRSPQQPQEAPSSGAIIQGPTDSGLVALTVDDGPRPLITALVLDVLRREKVKATFFVVGRMVEQYPELARMIVRDGHELANHSYSHPRMTVLSERDAWAEMHGCGVAVVRVTGRKMRWLRPPGGAHDGSILGAAEALGYGTVLWTVNTADWLGMSPDSIAGRGVGGAAPGAIILVHQAGMSTVEALPLIIEAIRAKGLGFATLSELMGTPGSPRVIPTSAGDHISSHWKQ